MNNKHIIISCNDVQKYLSFWPTVSYHWQSLGYKVHLAFVTERNSDDDLVKIVKTYGDSVFILKPIEKYNNIIQSKLARFYITKFFANDIVIIKDIDEYSLDNTKYDTSIIDINKIVTVAFNAYINESKNHYGLNTEKDIKNGVFRFPATPTIGLGHKIYSLFNTSDDATFEEFVDNIQKQTLINLTNEFSDEAIILKLNTMRPEWVRQNISYIKRDDYCGICAFRRIDRGNNCNHNVILLHNRYYIDMCPSRPYNKNEIGKILDFLNIPDEVQKINIMDN